MMSINIVITINFMIIYFSCQKGICTMSETDKPQEKKIGRPRGSGHRIELFNEVIMPNRMELAKRMMQAALDGSEKLMMFFGERMFPRSTDMAVRFDLPDNVSEKDLFDLGEQILRLTGEGAISPDQAQMLTNTLKLHRDGLLLKTLMDQVKGLNDKVENLQK